VPPVVALGALPVESRAVGGQVRRYLLRTEGIFTSPLIDRRTAQLT
jgi:hypothetical protein